LVKDPTTGQLFVRKKGASVAHIREEATALDAYRAAGVRVPNSAFRNGDTLLMEYVDEADTLGDVLARGGVKAERALKQVRKDFVADAFFGNWDVTGLSNDNILMKGGKATRIDLGGSLRFRAQGAAKAGWGDSSSIIGEFTSLRNPGLNKTASFAFEGLSDADILKQARAFRKKKNKIRRVFKRAEATKGTELLRKIDNRFDALDAEILKLEKALAKPLPKTPGSLTRHPDFPDGTNLTPNPNGIRALDLKTEDLDAYDDIRQYTGNGYEYVNKPLYTRAKATAQYRRRVENIDRGLKKLKSAPGETYRRLQWKGEDKHLYEEFLAQHKVGEAVNYNTYMSTTRSKHIFGNDHGGPQKIRLVIDQKTGRDVDPISLNKGEDETLMGRDSVFQVTEMIQERSYNGTSWIIHLKEIVD
jgi:hypothetical protein